MSQDQVLTVPQLKLVHYFIYVFTLRENVKNWKYYIFFF